MGLTTDTITEYAKAGPPVAVSGLTIYGIPLPDIVQIATGIYVVLLGLDKLYIMLQRYRADRRKILNEIKNGDKQE